MESKYKLLAYMPLHYGAEYLEVSLGSVVNFVDKVLILYTPSPSYGHGTTATCPDTEEQMRAIAEKVCGDKLIWIKGEWGQEGAHRNEAFRYSGGFDGMLAIDADEVFDQIDLPIAIEHAMTSSQWNYGVTGYVNFWRSFNHTCHDFFNPIRFINLHRDPTAGQGLIHLKVYHFSCAQSKEVMHYKYEIHGHKDEIRKNWLQEIYYGDQMQDVHPTSFGLWNATPFDKETLPEELKQHPNFNKERI